MATWGAIFAPGSTGPTGSPNGWSNGLGGGIVPAAAAAPPANVSVNATATPNHGPIPLTVRFNATTNGGSPPFTFVWSLPAPGGGNLTGRPVNYTFTTAGYQIVTVRVYNTSTSLGTVLVGQASVFVAATNASSPNGTPALTVTASPSQGYAPISVHFAANVTGAKTPYVVVWPFRANGSMNNATGLTSRHTFGQAGVYNVTARLYNGTNASSGQFLAQGSARVIVSSNNSSGNGSRPLSLGLSASPQNRSPATFRVGWSIAGGKTPYYLVILFGDGSSYGARNLSVAPLGAVFHTYSASGRYSVNATVWDSAGNVSRAGVAITVSNASSGAVLADRPFAYWSSPTSPVARVGWNITGGAPPYGLVVAFGDGRLLTINGSAFGSVLHTYARYGSYQITETVGDSGGNSTNASILLAPPPILVSLSAGTGTNVSTSTLQLVWNVTGGAPPYTGEVLWRDGNFSGGRNASLTANGTLNHTYSSGGTFVVLLLVWDSLGGAANGSLSFTLPVRSPPVPVSVVVVAEPVTGPAPLLVNFSAEISGGSAPFAVNWSLALGNSTVSAAGLMTSHLYRHAGWYPTTAFVFNFTTPVGAVLVGQGGVWVDVTAGGGNGSGNGSGHLPRGNGSGNSPGSALFTPSGASLLATWGGLALLGGGFGAGMASAFVLLRRRAPRAPPPG